MRRIPEILEKLQKMVLSVVELDLFIFDLRHEKVIASLFWKYLIYEPILFAWTVLILITQCFVPSQQQHIDRPAVS